MNIVILSSFYGHGGAKGIAMSLAKSLKKMGHRVSFVTTAQERDSVGRTKIDGIKIYRVYAKYNLFWRAYVSIYNPMAVRKIRKILGEIKPDIVHAHNVHTYLSYYALKIAKKTGARVFLTVHDAMLFHYVKFTEFINKNDFSCPERFNYKIKIWQKIKRAGKTYNPLRDFLIKHYVRWYVDRIFAVSGALKDALSDNGVGEAEVVHNGIDASAWKFDAQAVKNFKNKYNLNGKKIILFGGRLGWLKGGREICLAMKEIAKEVPGAVLLLAGKIDDEVRAIMKFAEKTGVGENIIAAGWLSGEELRASYYSSDVVTVPSICFDPFPTVNLEAMACAKPVVATCFGGSREVVLDGKTGFIVNPLDIEKLSRLIIRLLKDANLAEEFGKAGRERVIKEFSLEKFTSGYLDWYFK